MENTINTSRNENENRTLDPPHTVDPRALVTLSLEKTGTGKTKSTISNFITIMEEDPALADKISFNEILSRPAYNGQLPWRAAGDVRGDWTDFDDANLKYYIEENYHISAKAKFDYAFTVVMHRHKINPFLSYLEKCEAEWDGKARIESFLQNHFGIEGNDEYYAAVLINYMFAIISRAVYWPGCKYDYVPVLVGKQGIGKSTFFESLAGKDEWFTDSLSDLKGKDAYIQIQGKIIAEMGELITFKKSGQETLKAFITAKSDYYRSPYGRYAEDHKRRIVFAGTTNVENFLVDRTGNRRYLPIHLKNVSVKKCGIAPEIVSQLWGEALHRYKAAGYDQKAPNLRLNDNIEEIALRLQMEHLEEDSWSASIEGYLLNKKPGDVVSTMDLYVHAIGATNKPSRSETSRIIEIMNNELTGWKNIGRKRDKNNGNMRIQTWQKMHQETEVGAVSR